MIAFARDRFGGNPLFPRKHFELPGAVSLDSSREVLRSGYKLAIDSSQNPTIDIAIPLIVAQSKEQILPTFYRLLDFVAGRKAHVEFFVDSFTQEDHNARTSLWTPEINPRDLKKTLRQYEDLMLNDGHHAYAVAIPSAGIEIQLDDHKLILIYADSDKIQVKLTEFLEHVGIDHDPTLPLIVDKDHHHHTQVHHRSAMEQLVRELGLSDAEENDVFDL